MVRKSLAILSVAVAVTALAVGTAQAQQVCGPRSIVVQKLKSELGEKPEAAGLTHSGGVIEILASRDGTWTVIMTAPNGLFCLLAAGEAWELRGIDGKEENEAAQAKNWRAM
jgi:hypothetical protein